MSKRRAAATVSRSFSPNPEACARALELLLTPKNSVISKGRPTTNGPDDAEGESGDIRARESLPQD